MSKPKDFLFVKAEYGAHFHVWYWQVRILFQSDDEALLSVSTPAKKYDSKLVREQIYRVKDFVRQINFLAMPATNYDADLSDDCYHLGVSVDYMEDGKRWCHKVPTGPVVIVSATQTSPEHMYRFLHFLINIGEVTEQLSGIEVPGHVKLRWMTRQKEILASAAAVAAGEKAASHRR